MRRNTLVPIAVVFAALTFNFSIETTGAQTGTRVPLREGLTIVTAINEPGKGDYESIKTITKTTEREVQLKYSADVPEPPAEDNPFGALLGGSPQRSASTTATTPGIRKARGGRTVRREDLETSHEYRHLFSSDSNVVFPGSTALGFSAAGLAELKTSGQTALTVPASGAIGGLAGILDSFLGGSPKELSEVAMWSGTLKRVDTVRLPVLVNGALLELPAVHARGQLGDEDAEFWILDDAENPLALKWTIGDTRLHVIKVSFPTDAAGGVTAIERDLNDAGRAVVYGIYFDFASDRIKEESEPVLAEIAQVMTKYPTWTLRVEGHTDDIGSATANLDLSRRRAAAVKQALVERRIAAARLVPGGFGSSRPQDTNKTIEGRARNRRVELVKN